VHLLPGLLACSFYSRWQHHPVGQVVEEIYDAHAAGKMGVNRLGQVLIMIHSGSRGLGHQVATDALVAMEKAMERDGIEVNDRQVGLAPSPSRGGAGCCRREESYTVLPHGQAGSSSVCFCLRSTAMPGRLSAASCDAFRPHSVRSLSILTACCTRPCMCVCTSARLCADSHTQLACARIQSEEGQNYLAAMACAANYAWVNRSTMTFLARQAFAKQFRTTPDELDMHVIYDVSHNIAKVGHDELGRWG